jgi:hypothetical protein
MAVHEGCIDNYLINFGHKLWNILINFLASRHPMLKIFNQKGRINRIKNKKYAIVKYTHCKVQLVFMLHGFMLLKKILSDNLSVAQFC